MAFEPFNRNIRKAVIPDHTITKFFGNNTENSDIKTMPDGFSPDSLNWITGTETDMVSLRRGTQLLGKTDNGPGEITGLGVGTRYDGTQVVFFTYGRKINYYDSVLDDTVEAGSNKLPVAADGDECSVSPYQNLAGAFIYVSSLNSSVYKIPVANPGTVVDQQMADYKGFLKFGQARSILFNRKGSNGFLDNTGLYMSWVDAPSLGSTAPFAFVNDEVVGVAGSSAYSYNLLTVTGKKTATQVQIIGNVAAGVETFVDDKNGNLSSNLGGTGTINYGTGAVSVTFSAITILGSQAVTITIASPAILTAAANGFSTGDPVVLATTGALPTGLTPGTVYYVINVDGTLFKLATSYANALAGTAINTTGMQSGNQTVYRPIFARYYTEDATNHGVLDYSFAASRVAGTGRYFSQFDGGGPLNAVFPLANVFYGFHTLKTWQTTFPTDDDDQGATSATNLPFREKMGVTYPYSAFGGTTGIYYINNSNPNRPEVYQLRLFTGATAANIASPTLISKALNLSSYQFDKAIVYEWGIYVLMCFQQVRNGVVDTFNSRTFLYNKKSGTWDLLDYPAARLAEYMGTLLAGDPLTNNIFTLFSGFDDDGSLIQNYWTSGFTNHGVPGQKVHNLMVIDGLIQTTQKLKVSLSFDGGDFIEVGGSDEIVNGVPVHHYAIEGDGSYVDRGKSIAVGTNVLGTKIIGGGSGPVFAHPFQREFRVNSPRYEYVRFKMEAVDGGYIQMNYYKFKDIRYKGSHSMPVRSVN